MSFPSSLVLTIRLTVLFSFQTAAGAEEAAKKAEEEKKKAEEAKKAAEGNKGAEGVCPLYPSLNNPYLQILLLFLGRWC